MNRKNRPKGYPTRVASLMTNTLHGQTMGRIFGEVEIWRIWNQTVGDQIAAKAQPSRYSNGVLTVNVVSAPWMQQLTFMKRDIIQRLNDRIGKELVREIYLKAGRPPAAEPAPQREKPAKRALSQIERDAIAAAVAQVGNAELRQAFAELMAEHLSHAGRTDPEKSRGPEDGTP